MKLYLMTDMEGCAGVLNHDDWVMPDSRWYAKGLQLLAGETNAVVEGFFDGGATEVVVSDGHGAGGLDPLLLDSRAQLQRGWPDPVYPLGLDASFDGVAWVGQHAKAGTDYSHITHTGWFGTIDESINGVSIGEYGQFALCAMELGVPCIFAGGEKAFAAEAQALTPGVVTAWVKRGLLKDGFDHLSTEEYAKAKLSAVHCSPAEARRRLRAGAAEAVHTLRTNRAAFRYPSLTPPYVRFCRFRASGQNPAWTARDEHPSSLTALINMPHTRQA